MTRKQRKGYLRGDPGGQAGADPADAPELVNAAEWPERVTVGDNSRGERRPDSPQGLDLGSRADVEVDDRGDDWRGLDFRSLLNGMARPLSALSASL